MSLLAQVGESLFISMWTGITKLQIWNTNN